MFPTTPSGEGSRGSTPPPGWRSRDLTGLAVGLLAAALLLLWLGFGPVGEQVSLWVVGKTAHPHPLWPLLLLSLLAVAGARIYMRRAAPLPDITASLSPRDWRTIIVALTMAGILLSLVAVWLLRAFPNSGDEYDYLFEARTFLAGRLWNPLLPGHEFFSFSHIFEKDGKWVSQYPPGWPLLLAGLAELGVPFWLAGPLCGAALLVLLGRFAQREGGAKLAAATLALTALTPYFAFNAGSYFSHVPAALCAILFCYCGARFIDAPRWSSAILAGAALGAAGLIRPYTVVFLALPFGIEALWRGRAAHRARFAGFAVGGLPFLAVLLWYDRSITGNALLPVTDWGYPLLKIGLHPVDEVGRAVSLLDTMTMSAIHLGDLAEWTSPLLVLAAARAVIWKLECRTLRFYDLVFPAAVIAYLFFAALGGNSYGPRYYFDAYPLLAMTTGSFIVHLLTDRQRPRLRTMVVLLAAAHLVVTAVGFISLSMSERRMVEERSDVFDRVARAGLHNAVVILQTGTGVISPMEPPDLARNGIDRDGDVLYVRDWPGHWDELKALLPGRRFYVYERPPAEVAGTLRQLP